MLTGKQKRKLRSIANTTNAIFQIGKNGLDENLVISIKQALKARELVKISILKNCDCDIDELALDIASLTKSTCVQKVGRTLVFYKPSEERIIEL